MLRVKISIATRSLSLEARRALHAAMQLGVQGVQFDLRNEIVPVQYGETARRQLLHFLNERGLQIASAHFPLRSPLAAPERMGERVWAVSEAIEFAAKLKIRIMTLRAGRLPALEDSEAWNLTQSVISELAAKGNQHGVTLALIPCGESSQELRQMVDSIKTGPVGIDADLAAWVMARQPIPAQLRDLHDLIAHFEIRDAIADMDARGREVPVGRGEIDWDVVAALWGEMDYTGWLNVDRHEGSDRAGDIARAVQFVQNLLPEFG